GALVNTASIFPPYGVVDLELADNIATDVDTIVLPADIVVTKTDGQSTASPGQPITYTIVVSNVGPNAADGVAVTDTVPASLTSPAWTCVAVGGAACAASGSGNINDSVNLPVGATAIYTLNGTVSPTPASLSNTATATLPAGFGDLSPENN